MLKNTKIKEPAVVVAYDILTAYGSGIDALWQGILSNQSAIDRMDRFETKHFQSSNAAIIHDINYNKKTSLVTQMLTPLLKKVHNEIPNDAFLILATTTGEIDILERCILNNEGDPEESNLNCLLNRVKNLAGLKSSGLVVSAACASSNTAIAKAASMIRRGEHDCVLVVACDCVSEFVFSGFSSLMALDRDVARPFDKNRRGLSLGEAAGFVLLMSKKRSLKEKRKAIAEISGWGLTNDANHMTGPSRNGDGLAGAIIKALESANISTDKIGFISSHGTGTVYNDSMEMKAFKIVFNKKKVPVYSIKGGIGHTLGTAGLIETAIVIRSLKEKTVLPTINLRDIDDEASGWVSKELRTHNDTAAITVNAGFGGINAALVVKI